MNRDPSLPPEPLPLTEASVQEIQLELIRRRRFNQFEGPKIVASLRAHRKLWRAVVMDRLGFVSRPQREGEAGVSMSCMIKLRDLPHNDWNVDDLYILCDTPAQAHEWVRIAEEEQWEADNVMVHGPEESGRMLGFSPCDKAVVSFWWD